MLTRSHLEGIIIDPETRILDAIKAIDLGNLQAALVADAQDRLIGLVTDGDVRRGLLRGVNLQDAVEQVMNRTPSTLRDPASRDAAMALMRKLTIRQVPVLDTQGQIVGLHHAEVDDPTSPGAAAPWVVIMAGGRGQRLHPLTEATPKPMLAIGGQPLVETIIRSLVSQDLNRIYLSLNYKADVFKDHFGDGRQLGADIRYVEEEQWLGTAGALGLLPERPESPVLVMNGDLLTQVNFRNLLAFHAEQKADATLCVREYSVQIPYGVVELDGTQVADIKEKPTRSYFVSAGIYVLSPALLDLVQPGQYLDMPQLLLRARDEGRRISSFPIHEYWLDIGKFDDLERAQAEFHRLFST
jgi:dTDP-glucose pyrophosphorylase